MQFSTLLISAAALIPSALGCLNISIVYTLPYHSSSSNLFVEYIDNGQRNCYLNQQSPTIGGPATYSLPPQSSGVGLNDTYQGCLFGMKTVITLDLVHDKNKKDKNQMVQYTYIDQNNNPSSYGPFDLGDRIVTDAKGDKAETWVWTTSAFC
ncbi:uncharacterized protein EAE97_007921 [Botrytis byssoidea]|uniref:Uncharacterized protein n=1 Tax=Botrytis byssoidea TaxID=139641 RepID=A0A9P5IK78_9HELO|nr:uncharacterized protein EAE97_007921 [Botrytis byssoidea]KAF7936555.1 hypothetical protein EAE97_007921 [Botrytis byssoidea]